MKFALATLFLAALAAARPVDELSSDTDGDRPDPSKVYFHSVTYGGTGCPQGSMAQSFSNDRTTFTLIFDKYVAAVGPGVGQLESRKNCQLNLNIRIPQGWQFSIVSTDFRGYVSLDRGLKATQKSIYYFQGETTQSSANANWMGPVAKDYLVSDRIPISSVVWSACSVVRPINMNTQVRIEPASGASFPNGARGQITTDSIDGKIAQKYGLSWRRC
jgi:hypothetical protein